SVYIDKVEGLHPIRAYAAIGEASPAYASATGKALLAWQTAEEIRAVAAQAVPITAATICREADILREVEVTRGRGYSINRGEWREGVWGVGAPILDTSGVAFAAIGVSGPQDRIKNSLHSLAVEVRSVASRLTMMPLNHHVQLSATVNAQRRLAPSGEA